MIRIVAGAWLLLDQATRSGLTFDERRLSPLRLLACSAWKSAVFTPACFGVSPLRGHAGGTATLGTLTRVRKSPGSRARAEFAAGSPPEASP